MTSLLTLYQDAVKTQAIDYSIAQENCLFAFDELLIKLNQPTRPWWSFKRPLPIKGIYLYGPVGAGKTYLMDLFFNQVPASIKKYRVHFHELMRDIDSQLRQLQGTKNPIQHIITNLSKNIKILCLDECLVNDLAFSMIFTELLTQLTQKGMIFIITSNQDPDHLYWKGVHRERFLPTIEAIKQHCHVIQLREGVDHRLRDPSKRDQHPFMNSPKAGTIDIQHREIPYVGCENTMIWFEFNVLCAIPRSTLDYIEIAQRFKTLFISSLHPIAPEDTTQAILFTHLIDVLYDHHIQLILLSDLPVQNIYPAGPLRETFKRTESRLIEMQSFHYQP